MRSLFSEYDPSFQAKVLACLEDLSQRNKENAVVQKAIYDKLDALVSVLNGPAHFVPMPSTGESQVPDVNLEQTDSYAEIPDMSTATMSDVSDRDNETLSTECLMLLRSKTECLMLLRSKASSERNFAVQVVHHLFKPHELDERNVREVTGKLPLDKAKLDIVRELVYKYYPVPLSGKESQWRDCRKAIDTYLRSKKYQMVHREEWSIQSF